MRMDEEIRMLQLDKPGQGKTNTEIQKHSIDDAVYEHKPLDRALFILSRGDELQKLSVIGSLPELLKYDQKGTVSKIIPKIQQELPNSSSEFQLAVSRMFNILMQMSIPVNLVPQILQGIENRDPIIANAWMETLLAVIPLLKEPIIKNEVLKCAISKSQLSKSAYFRVSSCKILGKISVHKGMNPFEVKKDVLPLVQSLCQDCFHEVRAAMCKELPNVAQGLFNLGDAIVKVNLLPLLVELSSDENVFVRSVAIESVVSIIKYLSADTVKGTIIPLAKKLCTRSASEGDTTYTAISSVFSTLIVNLQPQMTSSDAMWFLDYYNHICKKGLSLVEDLDTDPSVCMLCRENCAYCLPQIASMVLTQIPSEISVKWYHTFRALVADHCYIVRKAVAACFVHIVKILGQINKIVMLEFTKLLRDEDEEVLQALIPNIGEILELFLSVNVLNRDAPVQATLDIGRAMLKCQMEAFRTNNWRMKESLLVQWEHLPNCFPSDFIHQHFSPVVLNATIHGKARPVRSQAARTLLFFLKYSLKENHRKWIREMINTHLCASTSCYSRQVYIALCGHAIDIFSFRYFKDYFYLPLLNLAEDPIQIVRLTMLKMCPVMKQMLVIPVDRGLQLRLENIVSKMEMMESDRDVIMLLKVKLKEMRQVHSLKNEVLAEDKRRMDEEDRIMKGKWGPKGNSINSSSKVPGPDASKESTEHASSLKSTTSKSTTKRVADVVGSTMPFLDQHFYTDAGVSLPQDFGNLSPRDRDLKSPLKTSTEVTKLIESAENLTSWLDEISMTDEPTCFQEDLGIDPIKLEEKDVIISIENVNPTETLTENDIRALETTTTNMTDELKANIQSVNDLKPKSKRNSCIFPSEIRRAPKPDTSFKRRSLNILSSNESRIPISSRCNRLSLSEKLKSTSDHALDVASQRANRSTRLSKSSINLRNNDEQEIYDGTSRILSITKLRKDYVTDNIKKFSGSSNKVSRKSHDDKAFGFRRFSASDNLSGESLGESIINNNVVSKSDVFSQDECTSKSDTSVNVVRRNSGLPLSVRKKPK